METKERAVSSYQQGGGGVPFRKWRAGLADTDTRVAIDIRVTRFRTGNLGNSKSLGGGVSESKIDLGPGYRIYFGTDGNEIILLCGGDKSTRQRDIQLAKKYWRDYKTRKKTAKPNDKLQG